MHALLARASGLILLVIFSIGLLTAYGLQLAETNEYMGYMAIPLNIGYLASLSVALGITSLLMPTKIAKPSDFFSLLFGFFLLLPYSILHPIRHEISFSDFSLYFSVIAAPLVVVKLVVLIFPTIRFPTVMGPGALVWLVSCFCLVGLALALSNAPTAAGFDLSTSYERRIEGRSIFPSGTPLAYLNAAIVNGFAPLLAFVAGLRRNIYLLAFSIICGLVYFYLLGLKAPIMFIALAFMIGYAARAGKIRHFVGFMYFLLLGALALFFIEYLFFGFSLTGDYLIRRAFSVPPYIASAYFDFMTSGSMIPWTLIHGAETDETITFVVGEWFLGFPGLNANTNAFLYQLAIGGIPMYILTILLVAFVFALLDSAYTAKRQSVLLYLGFSYSILIIEQAATTALVSSGIGLLIVLAVFSRAEIRSKYKKTLQ
jgi:hypothetical protein